MSESLQPQTSARPDRSWRWLTLEWLLNQVLDWDGQKMEFTNIPADATIRILEKDGFSIKDGHPTFQNKYTDPVNARQFAANLIKRQYRAGYELPEMPE